MIVHGISSFSKRINSIDSHKVSTKGILGTVTDEFVPTLSRPTWASVHRLWWPKFFPRYNSWRRILQLMRNGERCSGIGTGTSFATTIFGQANWNKAYTGQDFSSKSQPIKGGTTGD